MAKYCQQIFQLRRDKYFTWLPNSTCVPTFLILTSPHQQNKKQEHLRCRNTSPACPSTPHFISGRDSCACFCAPALITVNTGCAWFVFCISCDGEAIILPTEAFALVILSISPHLIPDLRLSSFFPDRKPPSRHSVNPYEKKRDGEMKRGANIRGESGGL